MTNNTFSRRAFALGAIASAGAVAACGNGVGSRGSGMIDARVDATLNAMYRSFPNTRQLAEKSNGMLIMPLVTEAGLGFGGAYGRGALRVNNVTVDYYSVTKATGGLQIGAQQYAHVLFFMTEAALSDFRRSPGWAAGADLEYVISARGLRRRARRRLWPRRSAYRCHTGRHEIFAHHSLSKAPDPHHRGSGSFGLNPRRSDV